MKMADRAGHARLSSVLSAMEAILLDCVSETRKLEMIVEGLQLEAQQPPGTATLQSLQQLDLVIQLQEDIRSLTEALSKKVFEGSTDCELDIGDLLPVAKLGRVQERLSGIMNAAKIIDLKRSIASESEAIDLF